jgi:hypothetical protein
VAIAFKGYPVAFCLLALPIRRYGQALLPVAIGVVLTIYAFAALKGGFHHNVIGLGLGMQSFKAEHVLGLFGLRYCADPYDAVRIVALTWLRIMPGKAMLTAYHCLSATFALLCTYFTLFVPSSRWRRVMAVCLMAIIFPDVAADYKLLILIPDGSEELHAIWGLYYVSCELERPHEPYFANGACMHCAGRSSRLGTGIAPDAEKTRVVFFPIHARRYQKRVEKTQSRYWRS